MTYWQHPSRYYLEWFFTRKNGMSKRSVRRMKFTELKAMWHKIHMLAGGK